MFARSLACFSLFAAATSLSAQCATSWQGLSALPGADAQVRGSSIISSTAPQCPPVAIPPLELHEAENAGNSNLMTVKATDTNQELGFARKAYVRFDLASRSGPADNATLTLRAGGEVANGPENLEPGHFSISLWGLPDSDNADNWVENAITWSTAPGNDPLSSTTMDPAHAVLLARTDVFRNPGTGLIIKFTNANSVTPNALLDFVNTRAVDSRITLVVTVDDTSTGDGFIFSTREFTPTGGTLGQCAARLELNGGAASSPALADAYIRGGAYAATNYGTTADMRINGKASNNFDFARKAYLSFDLATAGQLTDVTLNLTHKQAVSNDTGLIHTLLLYGVKESTPGQDWIEGAGQTGVSGPTPPNPITWLNAPANDVTTSDGKVADQATLLAMIAGPRTYVTGDVIAEFNNYNSVTPNALIDFINSDTDGRVTFIITASASHAPFVGQEIGWRFATKEHATVAPPTLTLNRISACGDPVFDVNNSHTVDAADLLDPSAGFYKCVTGPGPEAALFEALSRECKCLDYNKDQAIDMRDFAGFQRCISTGLAQADPTCDD